MHTWTWKHVGDRPYLTCSLLDNWSHGFFTQSWWPSSPAEITPTLEPTAKSYRVKQVHGDVVLTPSDVEQYQSETLSPLSNDSLSTSSQSSISSQSNIAPSPFPNADGLRSEKVGQALWVASADCTPALIADVVTGSVAAAHAGWRGTAQKIVPKAIQQLQDQGSELDNIRVALGPAIAGDVYQVSAVVGARVSQTALPDSFLESDIPSDLSVELPEEAVATILEQAQALPKSPILDDAKEGHVRLDVRRVNQLQLEQLGLLPQQVAIAPYCTFQCPEHFFSYRRSRLKKVQWSGIVSR
ncbi:MAG: peptidoglycan editing factor PgeF [Merismopedia sp. SIO2A8]|nr:peptidoglycan editing factor PgeF [Merismopedia sp. SIO2A8]